MAGNSHLKSYCLVSVEVDMRVAVCWAKNHHQHYNYQASMIISIFELRLNRQVIWCVAE